MCAEQCTLVNSVTLLLFYQVMLIEDPTHCSYDRQKNQGTKNFDDDHKYNMLVYLLFLEFLLLEEREVTEVFHW
jgi:hypothetical protein